MSAPVLDARPPASPPGDERAGAAVPPPPARSRREWLAGGSVVALLVAALLPLTRVYVGLDFLRPVLAAGLLALAVAWATRRLGIGPIGSLLLSALAWALFTTVAFVPDAAAFGLVPTATTLGALRELWVDGIELIRQRPSPAFPEPGMLLVTTAGVWWAAHAIDGLVFRLHAPLRGAAMALLLWTVPLAMAPPTERPWLWGVPLLLAVAALLLATARRDLERLDQAGALERARGAGVAAWAIALVAILAGGALGGLLPGYGEPPYYEVRGLGGTTITTNPIVSIRTSLVSQGERPVAEVRTPQPVYLRLTALDVYSEREEWTAGTIRGGAASGRLAPETEWAGGRELDVEIEVRDLSGAVLVPVPYQPVRLSGPAAERFQYDAERATVTLASGESLREGDVYRVDALVPDPPPEVLSVASVAGVDPSLTALPASVPEEVGALARRIVEEAGADTPFEQAMAIQEELRTWTYSLDPPQGHSGGAMRSFLEQRIGYCEQFAGTMAVMLRTLDIPARVAVGYTPGELVERDDDRQTYVVQTGNAHAWVEVLFPGLGWLPFEPTPRSDGNVLTPTATNLLPTSTDAELDAPEGGISDAPPDDQQFLDDLVPPDADTGAAAPGGAGSGGGETGPSPAAVLVALAASLLLLGAVIGWRLRPGEERAFVPAERVLRALARVTRTGRGLGVPRRPWETDREYLRRLAGASAEVGALAEEAARARYARVVAPAAARRAERAARDVLERLRAETSRGRWLLAAARGRLPVAGVTGLRWRPRSAEGPEEGMETSERVARLMQRRRQRQTAGR